MLKYVDTKVTFAEVPDEISLCINISNCPNHCEGCHSPYLAEDIGTELTKDEIKKLYNANVGITCICFMGGDSNPDEVEELSNFIRSTYTGIKTAWYSGKADFDTLRIAYAFDYVKMGKYIEALGPLNSKTTNQRMFKVICKGNKEFTLRDITHKFNKDD